MKKTYKFLPVLVVLLLSGCTPRRTVVVVNYTSNANTHRTLRGSGTVYRTKGTEDVITVIPSSLPLMISRSDDGTLTMFPVLRVIESEEEKDTVENEAVEKVEEKKTEEQENNQKELEESNDEKSEDTEDNWVSRWIKRKDERRMERELAKAAAL